MGGMVTISAQIAVSMSIDAMFEVERQPVDSGGMGGIGGMREPPWLGGAAGAVRSVADLRQVFERC